MTCVFCQIREAAENDSYHTACGCEDYCSTCRHAHSITHTSVDDARQAIKEADIGVVYMALKMMRTDTRKTLHKMLQARLNKLTKDL